MADNKILYHSGVIANCNYDDIESYPPCEVFDHAEHGSVAFQCDASRGIPGIMKIAANVFYSETPWVSAWKKFHERAEVDPAATYREFLRKINADLSKIKKPAIIVSGMHAEKLLNSATAEGPVILNGVEVVAYCWRIRPWWKEAIKVERLLELLATRYHCLGDFCCGCGNSAKIFAQEGKRFIVSDINPHCIGYIAHHAPGWFV